MISRRKIVTVAGATALATLTLSGRASILSVPSLVLLDGSLSEDELAKARDLLAPWRPSTLKTDLVWEWRDDLHEKLAQGARAVAVTRWDKALLLSGLAREASLPVRQSRVGSSMFRTEIS